MIEFGSPIPYDIRIIGSSNKGFIVNCGCATLTFTDKEKMLDAIRDYLNDPKGVEKVYNSCNAVNRPEEVTETNTQAIGSAPNIIEPFDRSE